MTSATATRRERERRQGAALGARTSTARLSSRARRTAWGVATLGVAAIVTAGLVAAQPQESTAARQAPDFTLPTSDGSTVSLAAFRGEPVVLYFNEGAGCDSCLLQMAKIEEHPGFQDAGITVLPIVMNTAEQINADRDRLGVDAPFLLDDGTVSGEYGTLGTGMHAGLPGHGFVLIDPDGVQRWTGDYPSMWLDPSELLRIVEAKL